MPKATFFNLPEDKRQRIFDLAVEEFAENDYESASISRIVAQAGIAKGSFYQYFADKKDLYQYLLDEGSRLKMRFLAEHPPPEPQMGIFAYLRWLYRVGTYTEFAHPKLVKVAQRAMYGKGPFPDEWVRTIRREGLHFFRQLIEAGIASGQLRPDLDADLAAYMCYATAQDLGRYLTERVGIEQETDFYASFRMHEAELEGIWERFVGILERGMAK